MFLCWVLLALFLCLILMHPIKSKLNNRNLEFIFKIFKWKWKKGFISFYLPIYRGFWYLVYIEDFMEFPRVKVTFSRKPQVSELFFLISSWQFFCENYTMKYNDGCFRSSPPEVFLGKGVLKIWSNLLENTHAEECNL